MARLLATLIVAPVLLLSTSAQAHAASPSASAARHHASSSKTSRAARDPAVLAAAIAERYWNAVPCDGLITVRAYAALPAGLEPTTDGWATFASSLGPNDLAAPAASYTQCTVSLARWQWPTPEAVRGDWDMFCLTVVHEFGHLLGHPHSLTPGSVMAPVFTSESNVPPICRSSRAAVEAGATSRPRA